MIDMFPPLEMQSASVQASARRLIEARAVKDSVARSLKEANIEEEAAEASLISALQAANLTSIKLDSGEALGLVRKSSFSIPPLNSPEDRQKAIDWLKAEGLSALVREDVNGQSLGAALREYEAEKQTTVPPFFRRFDSTSVSVRKGR